MTFQVRRSFHCPDSFSTVYASKVPIPRKTIFLSNTRDLYYSNGMRRFIAFLTIGTCLTLQLRLGLHVMSEVSSGDYRLLHQDEQLRDHAADPSDKKITSPGKYFRRGPCTKSKLLVFAIDREIASSNSVFFQALVSKTFVSSQPLFLNLRSPPRLA